MNTNNDMKNSPAMNGPTLNARYNHLICVEWPKATGKTFLPACEDCGADLTGRYVFEHSCWMCSDCLDEQGDGPAEMCDEEFRRHERQQMGIH